MCQTPKKSTSVEAACTCPPWLQRLPRHADQVGRILGICNKVKDRRLETPSSTA